MKKLLIVLVVLLLCGAGSQTMAMKAIFGITGDIAQLSGGPTQFVFGFTGGTAFKVKDIKSWSLHAYVAGHFAENDNDFTTKYGTEGQFLLFVDKLKKNKGGNMFFILGGNYDWLDMAEYEDLEKVASLSLGVGYRYAFDPEWIGWISVQKYSTLGMDQDDDYNAYRIGIGIGKSL